MILVLNLIVCFGAVLTTAYKSPVGECTVPGQYLADSDDCTIFYECSSTLSPIRLNCSTGLCWNEATSECDFPGNVPCCSGAQTTVLPTTILPPDTTVPPETTETGSTEKPSTTVVS
ncbi:hypothetical protein CHUAL_001610 [Chamberlinius hualienensis]